MKILTDIYRSPKKEGLYLFVKKGQDLSELPDVLMKSFGVPEFSMRLLLVPEKKLARVNVEEVMQALEEKQFFLQMPPAEHNREA